MRTNDLAAYSKCYVSTSSGSSFSFTVSDFTYHSNSHKVASSSCCRGVLAVDVRHAHSGQYNDHCHNEDLHKVDGQLVLGVEEFLIHLGWRVKFG